MACAEVSRVLLGFRSSWYPRVMSSRVRWDGAKRAAMSPRVSLVDARWERVRKWCAASAGLRGGGECGEDFGEDVVVGAGVVVCDDAGREYG